VLQQLVSAMQYCHDQQNHDQQNKKTVVWHWDLKLQNVLLNREFQLKVADFGLAVLNGSIPPGPTTHGTRPFMAPEVYLKYTSILFTILA
jgi:serine/threonine protein kinase